MVEIDLGMSWCDVNVIPFLVEGGSFGWRMGEVYVVEHGQTL